MPSFEHGILVQIFRSQPELVPTLRASRLGVSLPASSIAVVAESTLDPLASADLRADLVVELRGASGAVADGGCAAGPRMATARHEVRPW